MTITEEEVGPRTVVVALDGRFDTGSAPVVEAALLVTASAHPCTITDLSAVRFISSAGLRVLLKAAKTARSAGNSFVICGLQPAVREVFEMTGFDAIIRIYAERGEAVARHT